VKPSPQPRYAMFVSQKQPNSILKNEKNKKSLNKNNFKTFHTVFNIVIRPVISSVDPRASISASVI
jgi:hypothetical protein